MGNLLPLLEVNFNEKMSFGDGVAYGLQMLLVGMLIVFAVLSLLWLSLELSGKIFRNLSATTKPAVEKKAEPAPAAAPVAASDDTELIAVLTAAIAAMESAPAARFRVVSFKRK
ncbi:MAG: OadG family protein [Clostridia bacterium]|nr:OadG family protein [Clostridia bacterium]